MSDVETVYDSTELQLRTVREITAKKLKSTDYAKPEMAQVMLERQEVLLTEVIAYKNEVASLRSRIDDLVKERESLLVELAKAGERASMSWLEIPASILVGFAINLLTQDFSNGLGWVLLIFNVIIILFLRMNQLRTMTRKGHDHAEN